VPQVVAGCCGPR